MRVVAKIGTASITDDRGHISFDAIAKLVDEVAALRAAGHEVIVVSSGAVAAGVAAMGMVERPADMRTVHAVSAIGQARLVQAPWPVPAGICRPAAKRPHRSEILAVRPPWRDRVGQDRRARAS